ncbi:DUF397 domain-containing protein [Saccharothrix luteola]|uniref:DUF397 domain-containing protein n=1 Tax=Saccharothrix luteola TaxID=2893018 RepID=UPI001E621A88|nr:DUF397 domain-containing protein [Saccharothrix luteola]MCC8248847.1 DUF397 domain-containing protein [Saccharothrix luteola]
MSDRTDWFKSSRSAENPACVEVRFVPDAIDVRDSKNPAGPMLSFPRHAWAKFLNRPGSSASP